MLLKSRRLGRRPSPKDRKTARFAKYLIPSAMPPVPAVRDWIAAATQPWGAMLNDSIGCHDEHTEVLTDRGWQRWPDYDGSPVGTMNVNTGLLEFQQPLATIRYDYDGPLYYSNHKLCDFALTPNHRMLRRKHKVLTHRHDYIKGSSHHGPLEFDEVTGLLRGRYLLPACPTGFVGADIQKLRVGDKEWIGDDFVAMVAIILSCGWAGGSESTRNKVSFCCFRDYDYAKIAALANRVGFSEYPYRRGVWATSDGALAEWLRCNAGTDGIIKAQQKRLPALFKSLSARQGALFLDYFGDKHQGHNRQFYSSSAGLIDDLQELLLRIGRHGGISTRPQRSTPYVPNPAVGAVEVTLTEWKEREVGFQSAASRGEIVDDHYRGEVFCVQTPNSTLITRRNKRTLISGNCCAIAAIGHQIQGWTANKGAEVTPSDQDILDGYIAVTGLEGAAYDPATGLNDNGCNMFDVCNYVVSTGIAGHKVGGFVELAIANEEFHYCIDWTGGVYMGFALPLICQRLSSWEIPTHIPSSELDLWQPGSWGGHAVTGLQYQANGVTVISWGQKIFASWDFIHRYNDEAYGFISNDWVTGASPAPNGLDLAAFQKDWALLR